MHGIFFPRDFTVELLSCFNVQSRVEPIPAHFALFNPCFVCRHFSSHQNVYWTFIFSVGDNQSICEYFTELQVFYFFLSPVNVDVWSCYTIRWYVRTTARALMVHFLLIAFCSRSDSLETKMTLRKPLLKFYC